ncbi:MAG: hypothetical protein QOD91_849 [Frankiales bacterium]|jgi:uncharacterized protein (DUF58 family)|nr:hypothetical protein [Frankiales bacterium]
MSLTGRTPLLAAIFVAIAFGWPAHGATVGWLTLALLVLVALDVLLAGATGALRYTRTGEQTGRLGEPLDVGLIVENTGRRKVRAVIRDAWPPSAAAMPRRYRVVVPAGERRRLDGVLVPTRRGDRLADRVTARSTGPLGLAGRQGWQSVPWRVRVLPPFTSRVFLPERLARLRQLDGLVAARVRGQGTEFDSLREYVPGDDVRSIDWRATARSGGVAVRTWRPERDRRILIVLDTSRVSAGRVGDVPRLDAAIDATLLLTALAGRAGDRIGLLAFDRAVRARVRRSSAGDALPAVVSAVTPLEPSLIEADYRAMVVAILSEARQRCLVVLMTGLEPAAVREGLLPALEPLLRRHTVLLSAVADPGLSSMRAGRGEAGRVYAAAAAEQAQAGRDQVSALLRRRGVEVVDEPPATFAPAVADAYLELKAAGRL